MFRFSLRVRRLLAIVAAAALGGGLAPLAAQTDYSNTDTGRPRTVEDAYAVERYAFELQVAPLRLERSRGGVYNWGIEPEIAYGILPRTQLEIGAPLVYADVGAGRKRSGLAGIDVSVLHNLNIETRTLPALGIVAEVLLPVGGLGPDRAYASTKGILTRTYRWARFHVNGQYTFGGAPPPSEGGAVVTAGRGGVELSRWLAGLAVDRTYPLNSMLITAEVFARQPIHDDEDVEWNMGGGVRYQLDPYFALDAGLGRRLTGPDRSWFVTFGLARAFAIRGLMPGR